MKTAISIIIGATFLMIACKKENSTTPTNSGNSSTIPAVCMDTTVNVDFVIQAIGTAYTGINFNSYGYDSNSQYNAGSNFNELISGI